MRTTDDISAARILAQGLAGPPHRDPLAVARHLVCLQGQLIGGVLSSVALRTGDRSLESVTAALNRGELVRTWTQRGTIHLVAAADAGWVLDLTAERMLRSAARRREELGLDDAFLARAIEIVTDVIRQQGPVPRAVLLKSLAPLGVADVPGREYHVITNLAMRQVIVQGPLADGGRTEQLFALTEDWIGPARRLPRAEAVAELMTRYVRSHGPATVADAARWSGLTKSDARHGIAAGVADGALAATSLDGVEYFHAPEVPDLLAEHRAAAHDVLLLPGFDELILGYQDRTATLARDDEALVVPGRNGMFKNTVIHRTRAVGTWVKSGRTTSGRSKSGRSKSGRSKSGGAGSGGASGPQIHATPFPRRRLNQRAIEQAARRHPALVAT